MSADGRIKYHRLEMVADAVNDTTRSVRENASAVASGDVANDYWEDDSVAGGGVSTRKKRPYNWIVGVERDKWGKVIKMCGIVGCQYKTGKPDQLKSHRAVKHGINVVWFSCDRAIHVITKPSKQAASNGTNNMFTVSMLFGTSAIHATSKQRKLANSNDTNKLFTVSTSFGTNAILATLKPSKQTTSNDTNKQSTKTIDSIFIKKQYNNAPGSQRRRSIVYEAKKLERDIIL